jgi:hypothetical protein
MAQAHRDQEWQALAERASKETDGKKLLILVAQLCGALDERAKPPLVVALKIRRLVNPASSVVLAIPAAIGAGASNRC